MVRSYVMCMSSFHVFSKDVLPIALSAANHKLSLLHFVSRSNNKGYFIIITVIINCIIVIQL